MLVVIGPSASGKTQIVNHLIKDYKMQKMVTYTTRPMRVNEVDGLDYHFISKDAFLKKIEEHFFLEYVYYNGNYYGTAKNDLTKEKVVIIEKDGLKAYLKEARDKIKIIYIQCSKPIRRLRMIERKDDEASINRRLANDDLVFDQEARNLADYIIDTSNSNVYDDAKKVYDFYQSSYQS